MRSPLLGPNAHTCPELESEERALIPTFLSRVCGSAEGSLPGVFPLDLLAGMLAVAGLLVIFGALSRRGRRPDLAERLRPFNQSVGDEAQAWLDRRGHRAEEN
jgi:hypothetical protein